MKRCPICKTVYPNDANFCPMDAGRLEAAPDVAAGPVPSLDLPTMQSRQVGGRFRLGPQLGGRRTGEVYAADDTQSGQSVAVKIIAPAVFPTPLVAQRTERELKQLMKVGSDRVARIFDVGRMTTGAGERMYVAMELVSGTPLLEIVAANGPLPVEAAVRLAMEIGEALAEAAKLGVIHRDVSPKNILVLADERSATRRVKLINFGIPTPVTDKVLGIPEFLSPEQAEGKPVDQRSNIYSLGELLYYMLVGTPPFIGEVDAVLRQQTQTPAPPPSQRAQGVVVPPDLDRLIVKALEKSSSRRHLTLRQLLGELEAILPQTQGVAAQAPPRPLIMPAGPPPPRPTPPASPAASGPVAPAAPAEHPAGKTMIGMSSWNPGPRPQAVIVPDRQPAVIVPDAHPQHAPVVIKPQPHAVPPPAHPQTAPVLPARAVTQQPTILAHPQPMPPPASPPLPLPPQPPAMLAQPQAPALPASQARPNPGPQSPPKSAPRGKTTGGQPRAGRKGKFRETMWFKKGELDEAVATTAETPDAPVKADELPIEDRYKDDGTLTADDRDRLSLHTGGTQVMPVIRQQAVPGERMGEDDLVGELKGGRSRLVFLVVAAVVVAAMVVVYLTVLRH